MSSFINTIKAIFLKDIVCELRNRHTLVSMIVLGVLMAMVFRIGAEPAEIENSSLAAMVIVVTILFAGILAGEQSYIAEQQNDCISGLIMAPVDAGDIFIAKLLANFTILGLFDIFAVPAVCLLFGINPLVRLAGFLAVIIFLTIGIAAAATLLGSIAGPSRNRQSLLSILMTAVLCPVLIPAVSALLGTTVTLCVAEELRPGLGVEVAEDIPRLDRSVQDWCAGEQQLALRLQRLNLCTAVPYQGACPRRVAGLDVVSFVADDEVPLDFVQEGPPRRQNIPVDDQYVSVWGLLGS